MVRLVTFALLALALPAAAQPPRADLTPEEAAWVAAHPRIRLMGEADYEPASSFTGGVHTGIAADVLALVAERTGLAFEVVDVPLPRRLALDPQVRGVDGVACSTRTPERERYYDVTTPYLVFPAYIVTRTATPRYLAAEDLNGLTVAVVAGYAVEEYFRTNFPKVKLDPVPDTDAALKKVSFGVVDAFVTDIPVTTYWVEQAGYTNLKVAGETGYVYRLGVSSRKDWPELGRVLQKGIESITPEEYEAIRQRWLNVPYESAFKSERVLRAVAGTALGAAVALGLMFAWNRALAHQVARGTRKIAAAERLYRTTLENVADAVLLADAAGAFVRAFPGAGGYALPATAADLLGPERAATAAAGFTNADATVAGRDGQPRHLLVSAVPVAIDDAVTLYVCRDATERLHLEAQVRQKQRLESVGLLASGVAHDFNNLVQLIQGFAALARRENLPPEEREEYLRHVESASLRAGTLTRQLLTFARKRPPETRTWNLNDIVGEMMPLIRQLVGRAAKLKHQPARTPAWVAVDRSQVEQVLLNLCANARDATLPEGSIAVTVGTDGGGPYLQVIDTGIGMADAVRQRVFEPFFTTKPDGQGTGLGLAVVHGIVEEHGGRIEVGSSPGQGTSVTVWWPPAAG